MGDTTRDHRTHDPGHMMPSHRLHVATYNIRLGIQKGLPAVADALRVTPALDLIALQEVGDHWRMGPEGDSTAEISELLALPYSVHVPAIEEPHDDGVHRYGHALLSRYPFSHTEVIDLPRNKDEPRALLHAVVDTPAGPLEVLSTHLSYLDEDRPAQGEFLLRWLAAHPATSPRMIMGDLNAPDDEPWLSTLLTDFTDADGDQRRHTFPSDAPDRRIDYILTHAAKVEEVRVIEDPETSDHFPLLATLILPAEY